MRNENEVTELYIENNFYVVRREHYGKIYQFYYYDFDNAISVFFLFYHN